MKRAAVIKAAGHPVTIFKLCSPRCTASYESSPPVRKLLEAYESGQVLPIPPKKIMQAYGEIMGQCKDLKQGAL
ncbi:hypothetical protein [Geomonas agri]|uniref:hypothetical protein n=1 Tax=Geomonas agri TaxID=2873702 RepID=UPI001CD66230|nr:hypothetical protein [Geomonas agri]